jgi:acyl-CoA synthetase (NDP forming)
MFISSLLRDSFPGKIYPINPKESEIMSLKSYPSILDIPDEIDLAIIAISNNNVPRIMSECSQKRCKFAIVHSAGFGELGTQGLALQEEMLKAARSGGVRIVGPNCMGLFSPQSHINTVVPYAALPLEPGNVAFICQSGWATENSIFLGIERGLRLSAAVSIGNQSDLTIEDFLEYFGNDNDTRVIAAYIEGSKQSERLMKLAAQISPRKPIIIWKGGSSEAGARAAASHTGSLAGSYAVFEAAAKQNGITLAHSFEELLDLATAFTCPYLPAGNRVGLLMEAGGGAVACADLCAQLGLTIPLLPEATEHKLVNFLTGRIPPSPSLKNPVDLVWVPFAEMTNIYTTALDTVLEAVDSCLLHCYAFLDDQKFVPTLEQVYHKNRKPLAFVPGHSSEQRKGMPNLVKCSIPAFDMPEDAIKALAALTRRAEYLQSRAAE